MNEGAILVEPDKACLSAGGKIFPLFKPHFGNTRLELEPQDAKADVDLAASVDDASEKIALTIVNRNPCQPSQFHLRLKNFELEFIEGIRLYAPHFLPHSDFEEMTFHLASCKNRLEFEMPQHSVVLITANVVHL